MAVTPATTGSAELNWPVAVQRPQPLPGGGIWTGFFLRLPEAWEGNGHGRLPLVGYQNDPSAIAFTGGNHSGVAFNGPNLPEGGLILWASSRRAGLGLSAASDYSWIGQRPFELGRDYLILWGSTDPDSSGAHRLWRSVVPVAGEVADVQRQVQPPEGNAWSAASAGWLNQIFETSDVPSNSNLTRAGFAVEHVVAVDGPFPLDENRLPRADLIADLACGRRQWDDEDVLNGGRILDWRRLADRGDLGPYRGHGDGTLVIAKWDGTGNVPVPETELANAAAIALWSDAPAAVVAEPAAGLRRFAGVGPAASAHVQLEVGVGFRQSLGKAAFAVAHSRLEVRPAQRHVRGQAVSVLVSGSIELGQGQRVLAGSDVGIVTHNHVNVVTGQRRLLGAAVNVVGRTALAVEAGQRFLAGSEPWASGWALFKVQAGSRGLDGLSVRVRVRVAGVEPLGLRGWRFDAGGRLGVSFQIVEKGFRA